ncbi:thyrotropin-releasing hormone receptor-like isoform X2 [Anopheles aquasalis]|uniref:thyrotropin-releasing hormone receptor-like isoform X2 n=1 Tax=Anopheles aquasalis TaxID=42839 RepID=UPI00215AC64C|nr:thyrotropin-releasing hormone receptor-like isoform X2 [Anopheles aquasalis]
MPQIPEYIRATSMVFCIIIMCLGVIGNIMVPIVILKTKDMRNSTNIFLTNLSIADLLVLLVCTPTVLVEVNSPPEVWVLGEEMCKAVPFVELTVAHASVLTILAISFERYYAICEPLKAGYVCTKTRALLICLAAWTVAAILTSPILFFAEYSVQPYLDGSRAAMCLTKASNGWTFTFFLMTISLFFVLPLGVLIVLYAIIARNLIASDRARLKIRLSKPELSHKARKQVVLMLGAVVLAFFTCLLPFRVLTLWIIIVPEETFQQLAPERYYVLLYFCRIMLYLNSAVNPILYNLMSSKFRKGFLRLCSCVHWTRRGRAARKCRNRSATFTTTTTTTSTTITGNGTAPPPSGTFPEAAPLALGFEGLPLVSNGHYGAAITPNSMVRNGPTRKLTQSLDDLRYQLPTDRGPDPPGSSFYQINLTRQYSSPGLLVSFGGVPPSALKRQHNVTFTDDAVDPPPILDDSEEGGALPNGLDTAAEAEHLLLQIEAHRQPNDRRQQRFRRDSVPNPLKLKFARFAPWRTATTGHDRRLPTVRATGTQLSLDESLLAAATIVPGRNKV